MCGVSDFTPNFCGRTFFLSASLIIIVWLNKGDPGRGVLIKVSVGGAISAKYLSAIVVCRSLWVGF